MPENLTKRGETWCLSVIIKGKRYRESLHTSNLKDACRLRDKRIKEITAAVRHGERVIPWKEAVAEWAEHINGQLGEATLKRYAISLALVTPYFEHLGIHQISGSAISGFIAERRKSGATPATIRRDLTAVSNVLKYAEAMEWCEGNPTLSKRQLLVERREPITLPRHDEIRRVVEAAGHRFGAMILAAWHTGCRQGELVDACWDDLDLSAGLLTVIGKGRKRRVIELSPEAIAVFRNHPRTLNSKHIFCNALGQPFSQASSDFAYIRSGVDGVTFRFHDLRHLFAVETLQSGRMGIYDLQQHLGHTSVKTTEIYLAFLSPEQERTAKQPQNLPHRRANYL